MSSDDVFNPALYVKLKATQKISLAKNADGAIEAIFPVYDSDTGDPTGTRKIIVYTNDLLVMKTGLTNQLNAINAVLSDVSKIP